MSFLENVICSKDVKKCEFSVYSEDEELFFGTLEYLESKNKGSGSYTTEDLFEHLLANLRSDVGLRSYLATSKKKKPRRPRSASKEEIVQ